MRVSPSSGSQITYVCGQQKRESGQTQMGEFDGHAGKATMLNLELSNRRHS